MRTTIFLSLLGLAPMLHAEDAAATKSDAETEATTAAAKPAVKEEVVCRFEKRLGSNLKEKVCFTRSQQEQDREAAQKSFRDVEH
ncbi:MAG: hypothetical protein IPG63_05725 [Xanthomonadales bacterium]|jgi:hypothetical protein|nr:hypothetical protein [Xanthomonadales bacterium]MBK7143891.1 hypothetical protein [Xanthomonadales bacterium]MCC6562910.1 hypothetical protein [Xanthomonadales bacterium]